MAATSLTQSYNALLTTTAKNYMPVLQDNIFKDNVLLWWLDMNGRKRTEDGGQQIQVPLLYGRNTTAKNYSGYEVLDTTPQEGITSAFFDWKQFAVSVSISREEERKNSGKNRLLNLLNAKMMQAELTAKEIINEQLIGNPTSTTTAQYGSSSASAPYNKYFSGLARLIQDDNDFSASVGGINQNTEAWWRNVSYDAGAVAWATSNAGLAPMRSVWNQCTKGSDHPTLLLGDRGTFEAYEGMLFEGVRYTDTRFGDAGFGNLLFKGAPYTYDEYFEDISQDYANDDGHIYFLNDKYLEWVVDEATDFVNTPFRVPVNQMARTMYILLMGELVSGNRRRLGVIWDINSDGDQ